MSTFPLIIYFCCHGPVLSIPHNISLTSFLITIPLINLLYLSLLSVPDRSGNSNTEGTIWSGHQSLGIPLIPYSTVCFPAISVASRQQHLHRAHKTSVKEQQHEQPLQRHPRRPCPLGLQAAGRKGLQHAPHYLQGKTRSTHTLDAPYLQCYKSTCFISARSIIHHMAAVECSSTDATWPISEKMKTVFHACFLLVFLSPPS